MTTTPNIIDITGCTRAEARARIERFERWFDAHTEAQVRAIASRWLLDDDIDPATFQSELAAVRAEFTRSRAECRAIFARALDEQFGGAEDA